MFPFQFKEMKNNSSQSIPLPLPAVNNQNTTLRPKHEIIFLQHGNGPIIPNFLNHQDDYSKFSSLFQDQDVPILHADTIPKTKQRKLNFDGVREDVGGVDTTALTLVVRKPYFQYVVDYTPKAGVYGKAVHMIELDLLLKKRCKEYWKERLVTERAEVVKQTKAFWDSQTKYVLGYS